MSFIGNKPFVDTCLDALSSEEQISLLSIINNPNAEVSGYYKIYHSEDGFTQLQTQFPYYYTFYYVSLSFDWIMSSFHEGFLIRLGENDYGFLGFEKNNQNMIIASLRQLPGKNGEYNVLQEQLTTEEFRRVLNDLNDTPTALANKSDLKLYRLDSNPTIESLWEKFGTNVLYATFQGVKYLVRLEYVGNAKRVYAYPLGESYHYVAELQDSSNFRALINDSSRVNEATKLYRHKLRFTAGGGNKLFEIITTISAEFRQNNLSSSSQETMVAIVDKIMNVQGVSNTYNLVSVEYNGSKYYIRITKITFNLTDNTFTNEKFTLYDTTSVTNFSDTVTEL